MTFEELVRSFETHTGLSGEVDNAQLAIWMNEAQLDLSLVMGNVAAHTFTEDELTDGGYRLPADCLKLVDSTADYTQLPDGRLQFTSSGGATVYYRKNAAPFTGVDLSQISELPEPCHYLLPMWAASRYWDMESEGDGEESTHGTKWMNYYLQGKANLLRYMDLSSVKLDAWRVI